VSTRYRTDNYKLQLDLASLLANQEGEQGASRHTGNVRFDRFVSQDAFVYTNAGLERDQQRALNLRTHFGGGLGWKVLNTAERELSLLGGVNYVNEQFRRDPSTLAPPVTSGEGQFGIDWRTVSSTGLEFTTRFALMPNIVQLGRYRLAMESGARVPLVGRYVWSLSVFNRYDSRPPVAAQRTDYGAVSSFGVSF
jgi:putative salt-induced outer membrane protein YdiY